MNNTNVIIRTFYDVKLAKYYLILHPLNPNSNIFMLEIDEKTFECIERNFMSGDQDEHK